MIRLNNDSIILVKIVIIQIKMINLNNNAMTNNLIESSYEIVSLDQMNKYKQELKNCILQLTNIKPESYEDYEVYFQISGSQIGQFVVDTFGVGGVISTTLEHLSVMSACLYYN